MGHWRSTAEGLIIDGKLPALVAADIVLVNLFGNCEWPSIRAAIDDELREVKAWTDWHHAAEAITILPCGDELTNNRGAEHGGRVRLPPSVLSTRTPPPPLDTWC